MNTKCYWFNWGGKEDFPLYPSEWMGKRCEHYKVFFKGLDGDQTEPSCTDCKHSKEGDN